ncbi:MAG TPA: pilus assembly protein TadG-related protein [Nocardioides sp.]|uniref:pilus assembly protein TadG-related protein n=1 Tax=Nocardioides sp. TaxID=35761 RepID=UPI002C98D235|nr:pilus assembly protein TadG-related protein [Nocardioides sp.]HQR26866.1 pilus assembly protein TadG-related protein [Nocardioides sp.]
MRRLRSRRGEGGYAAILVAMLSATILLPLSAIAVDVSRWYVEVERVQNAADAAAMAGVTFLPIDLASATSTAKTVASRNGYTDGVNATVTVAIGDRPTQLKVTVATTVENSIAGSFTDSFTTISRSAVSDYNGPAPMGSPCNTFGNEPAGTANAGPVGSQLTIPSGGASCTSNPMFWGSVDGPSIYKVDGDQIMTRACSGSEDGCTGGVNAEFRPQGYFYIVRVAPGAVGLPVTVQVYDPAYVYTGQQCESKPGTPSNDNMNTYANTDAKTRYRTASTANIFCNGDTRLTAVSGGDTPTVTSFGMRSPVDTFVPMQAPPMSSCVKQYPGYDSSAVTLSALTGTNAAYNQKLASVFHQWVPVCTFTPTTSGDYYLQIRTNVALSTSNYDGRGGYNGNMAVFNQTGDNTAVKGSGANTFAIRAISSAAGSVSVAGWDRMGMWMNTDAVTSTFNLVRVVPAAATKTLDFEFFDAGDAASGGTIKVLPPTETAMSMSGCTGFGKVTGTLTNCQVTGVSSSAGWNGKSQHIKVPIPATYTCNAASAGGCWFRLQVSFGAATVHDTTTWGARIEGDPVRLIK